MYVFLADHVLKDNGCIVSANDHSNIQMSSTHDFMAFQLYDNARVIGIQEKSCFKRMYSHAYVCMGECAIHVYLPKPMEDMNGPAPPLSALVL